LGGRTLSFWVRVLAVVVLGCTVGIAPARAQDLLSASGDEPAKITADGVEFDKDLNVFTARGNVRIEQGDTVMTADWVALNNVTRHGIASGNVVVTDAEDILYADFLQFNLDTGQGVVYDGELEADTGFRMVGSEVRKTGDETYEFEDAVLTTCNCPDEDARLPWTIKASEADLRVGGYAVTKNTTINVLGVPVLWTPRGVFPVKSDRQSGLLFPLISNSRQRGFEVGVPFFWAAHPQVGLTITPTYGFDVGPYLNLDLEYALGNEGSQDFGTLAATINPDDSNVDPLDPATPFDETRWGVRFRHQQVEGIPWGIQAKAFINWASDNDFPTDYDVLDNYRRDRFLPSLVSATKIFSPFGSLGSHAAVRWADDLQAPDDRDRDDFLLQRLPELTLTQAASFVPESRIPFSERFLTSFDLKYTNFYYQQDPLDVLPESQAVGNVFLDTGIDALPDGQERNEAGFIVTLDGDTILPDGSVITAQMLLDDALAADPEAMLDDVMMDIAPFIDPDQSKDTFPGVPDGRERDGLFQEGEPLLDKGNRLLVNPRVAVPFRVGDYLEVLPELGYHGTFYQTSKQSFSQRNLITGRVDVRSRLRKVIDIPWLGGVDHLLEPRFSFYGVADLSSGQDDNPLFVPQPLVPQERVRQLELENVLRDPSDRIRSEYGVTVGVSNRFYTIEPERDPEDALEDEELAEEEGYEEEIWVANRLFADVNTSFQYRFNDLTAGWFVVDGTMYPTRSLRLRATFGWDMDAMDLGETKLEAAWRSLAGHTLGVRYRYLRTVPAFFEDVNRGGERFDEFESEPTRINQIDFFSRVTVTPQWSLLFNFRYSIEDAIILTNRWGVEYISKCQCWAVQFTLNNDRDQGVSWRIRYTVLGLGDERRSPF
jgi:lipopolysaccharide assembly outer membrane protein LptD (OstA)